MLKTAIQIMIGSWRVREGTGVRRGYRGDTRVLIVDRYCHHPAHGITMHKVRKVRRERPVHKDRKVRRVSKAM